MPEEEDLEQYLAEIRQKMKNYNIWDDIWIIGESNAQEQGISSDKDS